MDISSNHKKLSQTFKDIMEKLYADSPSSFYEEDSHSSTDDKEIRIPRPQNSFILYRGSRIADAQAILTNDPSKPAAAAALSKLIASWWRAESEGVKAEWQAKADAAKAEHERRFPGYKYRPKAKGTFSTRGTSSKKKSKPRKAPKQGAYTTVDGSPMRSCSPVSSEGGAQESVSKADQTVVYTQARASTQASSSSAAAFASPLFAPSESAAITAAAAASATAWTAQNPTLGEVCFRNPPHFSSLMAPASHPVNTSLFYNLTGLIDPCALPSATASADVPATTVGPFNPIPTDWSLEYPWPYRPSSIDISNMYPSFPYEPMEGAQRAASGLGMRQLQLPEYSPYPSEATISLSSAPTNTEDACPPYEGLFHEFTVR